jgi:two-component system, OmpR family, sensor histidine kinase BaeS
MRLRLILSFILVVLVSVFGVVWIARQNSATAVRAFMYRGGMSGTGGLVSALQVYYQEHGSWQGVADLLNTPRGHGQGMGQGMMGQGQGMNQRLRVADASGVMIADTTNPVPSGSLSRSEMSAAIALQVDGQTVGYLLPEGGMPFNRADETFLINSLTNAALTAGLIAGGVALVLALLLAYNLMRPVREMTAAAQRLGGGDLSQRVQVHGSDELAVLGHTFNQMADSLQQAQKSRKAMTADIAHELRNPLAVQRAHLEALQDGIYPLNVENLQPVLDQNLLLTRLVDDLRTLALADAGQLQLEYVPTDLAELVMRVVDRFRAQAAAYQIALRLGLPEQISSPVWVDPMRIEQILSNLISNALRYTPRDGFIEITLTRLSGRVRVEVRDSGPGIPTESLAQIFERFYRVDRSRSREEGGSGLGLAIARQLAEVHGGTLQAANHPEGGALFTLEVPDDLQQRNSFA